MALALTKLRATQSRPQHHAYDMVARQRTFAADGGRVTEVYI